MSINSVVQNSSSKAIEKAFQRVIKNHLPHNRWLGFRNRYRKDTIKKINKDLPSPKNVPTLKERQITEYISVSTVTHCTDGWNYLSRSVESIIAGDQMSAIHLAYYAELRAVLSLMATQGIGVFSTKHIWFDSSETCRTFGNKTHDAANDLINEWSQVTRNKSVIFDIVKVNSKNLTEWVTATGYSHLRSITDNLLKDWLHKWSIDLKLKEDQDIRNEASYRPKIFPNDNVCRETIEKIATIWTACEPTTDHGFQVLDSHLLRLTLDEVFSKSSTHKTKKDFITDTIQSAGLSRSDLLHLFLSRSHLPDDHLVITEARKEIRIDNLYDCTYDCFPIICRALLLLRLATGATEKFLKNSTITKDLTKFWWHSIGFNLGFWANGYEPKNFNELYQDIAETLNNLEFDDPSEWESLKTATDTYANELIKLKQFQRVGLWGIGL